MSSSSVLKLYHSIDMPTHIFSTCQEQRTHVYIRCFYWGRGADTTKPPQDPGSQSYIFLFSPPPSILWPSPPPPYSTVLLFTASEGHVPCWRTCAGRMSCESKTVLLCSSNDSPMWSSLRNQSVLARHLELLPLPFQAK